MITSPRQMETILKLKHYTKQHIDIIVSIILALSVFWWTHPDSYLLYGLDEILFYIRPFGPFLNPLNLVRVIGGASTVAPIGGPFFYVSLISQIFLFVASPPMVERMFFAILIFLETYGIFRVFSSLDLISNNENNNKWLGRVLASSFYVFNPFTLTVTLWHLEGWTFPMVVLPYWISTFLEIIFLTKLNKTRFLETAAISIILAPAIGGEFAPLWMYIIFVSILFVTYRWVTRNSSFRSAAIKSLLFLLMGAITLIWANIPGYIYDFVIHINPNFLPINNYYLFYSLTKYSPILRVLGGLTVTPWLTIYPPAYDWTSAYATALTYSGYLIIPLLLFGLFYLKKVRYLTYIYVLSIPVIIFSMEGNFPFVFLNRFLLGLGGPFLAITNAYYFLGEIYILSISVLIYLLFSDSLNLFRKKPRFSREKLRKAGPRNIILRLRKSYFAAVFMIVLIVVVTPLVVPLTSTEYQQRYQQIDMFKLPPSFSQLSSFLYDYKYTGPSYNLLVLPVCNSSAYYFEFNGSGFGDTSSLFSALVPYPVIATNNNWIDQQLIQFLWSINYSNIVPVFQALHIKYVVFNPYYSQSSTFIPPNGTVDEYTKIIYDKLNIEVGNPIDFGGVYLFIIPNSTPLIYPISNLGFIETPTYLDYLNLLSNLPPNDNGTSILEKFLWVNNTENLKSYSQISIKNFYENTDLFTPGQSINHLPYKYSILVANGTDYYVPKFSLKYNFQGDVRIQVSNIKNLSNVFLIASFYNSSDWSILNSNAASRRVYATQYANTFKVTTKGDNLIVNLGMNRTIELANVFVYFSIFELISMAILWTYWKGKQIGRLRKSNIRGS